MDQILAPLIGFDPPLRGVLINLTPAVLPFLLAIILSTILGWLAIHLSPRVGMMKRADRERDLHKRAIPMLGGASLYLAFAGVVLLVVPNSLSRNVVLGLCGAAAFFFLLDDRFCLPAWVKLIGQLIIAGIAVLGFHGMFQITFFTLPWVGIVQTGWLAIPLSIFWLLGMQNTVNFIDGVDGLAAGVVAIVALTLVVAAAGSSQHQGVLLSATLAGSCLGYLVFNFHPAKLFMADSGAHFLGVALGLLSIMGVAKLPVALALVIPLLGLAVPILDTAFSIVRRRLEGVSMARADSWHIHHRLLGWGLSQRQTCLVFYGATAILGAVGLTVLGHRKILGLAIVLMMILLSTALAERLQDSKYCFGPSIKRLLGERRQTDNPSIG